jgi:glycosyltransferase involved in cell wall biosynthesis
MGAGGLETYLVNVLRVIDRRKFNITIVATGARNDWYKEDLESLGVEYFYCPNSYTQLPYMLRMRKVMQERKIDVVCDFRNDFSASTLCAAKSLGIKSRVAMYRSTRQSFEPTLLKNLYLAVMHFFTSRLATKIMGNTTKVIDAFYNDWKGDKRFAVVHNAVDVEVFCPQPINLSVRRDMGIAQNAVVIGHTGSFRIAKNHSGILKAFALLSEQLPDIRLLLLGDGALRGQIEQSIRELKIEEKVILAGNCRNIARILNTMNLFYYPSIYEGMPMALVEAMACGLPFVASNIPEIVEVIPPDLHGQLFDVNDISGQVNALKKIIENPQYAREVGRLAREHVVKNFSMEKNAQKFFHELTVGLNISPQYSGETDIQ